LFQCHQSGTHRRARSAQTFGELLLRQALTGLELTAEDQVAQLHQNCVLQGHEANCTLKKENGIPFAPPLTKPQGHRMKAELNQRLTQVGPGTPGGEMLRRYWQPVALLDEFDPTLDPRMAVRPVKAVRLLGQNFVLFRNASG